MDENKKFCGNCGAQIDANVKFCPNCGKSPFGLVSAANNTKSMNPADTPHQTHFKAAGEKTAETKSRAPVIALTVLILIFAAAWFARNNIKIALFAQHASVTGDNVMLRVEPSVGADFIDTLYQGDKVIILDKFEYTKEDEAILIKDYPRVKTGNGYETIPLLSGVPLTIKGYSSDEYNGDNYYSVVIATKNIKLAATPPAGPKMLFLREDVTEYYSERSNEGSLNKDNPFVSQLGNNPWERIALPKGTRLIITGFGHKDGKSVFMATVEGYVARNLLTENFQILFNEEDIRKLLGDIWYKVELPNKKTGWVFGKYLKLQT